ncbi:hypothetical protein MJG53_016350 [Ovis ammon polii x Ovis aries]|uniref:Uncharacterized protein n=1 Tax=Ovis ammon polii x Ovis aries TaxID=2918886 RepID=A0ACB9UBE2_9CETA|nr:hypothetical protein MJG53_016350 [Ovis ammon polii x Ovis aries]
MAKWAAVVNQERQDEIGNLNLTYPLWQNNNNQRPPKPKQADLVMQCVSLQYFFFLILSNKQYFLSLEGSSFTIDSIGIISTSAVSDFESEARSFSLVTKVVDPGGLFTAGNLKVFLINVNNKDPILTCRSFNMENAILSVTSANSTLHNDVNITLDEEIPTGKTVARQPKITWSVEQWLLLLALMWREPRLHVVSPSPIKACEGDWQCAAILVTLCICGMNDNAPFFDQYLIRYAGQEMIAKDTVVAKLQCHDLDEPPDAIHYAPSLGPIGSGQLFEQAPTAGNFIQVVKELDYEDPDIVPAGHIYEMTISVFDDLHPSHTVTVTIIVETAPANDFSPVFKDVHYSFSIPETSGVDRPDAGREHCRFSFPLSMMTCLLPLQRKGLTIVYTAINTYKSSDWYIPFVFSLTAIFFAGEIKQMAGDRNQKEMVVTGNRNKTLEVLTETIVYETVFDGEAVDPEKGRRKVGEAFGTETES